LTLRSFTTARDVR